LQPEERADSLNSIYNYFLLPFLLACTLTFPPVPLALSASAFGGLKNSSAHYSPAREMLIVASDLLLPVTNSALARFDHAINAKEIDEK
jgi:hypothetical protein